MAEKQVADLSGIKAVEQPVVARPNVPTQAQVYEIPLYQSMTAKDGSKVDVLVNVAKVTKAQLTQQIAQFQSQIDDLNAKLTAITGIESAQVKVAPVVETK